MKISKLLRGFAVASALTLAANVFADDWLTDYKEAQKEAKAANKLVLLNFTGSDWCGWCIKMDRDVFSKPEFKDFASKNLVLVTIDFPRSKPLATEVRKQNEQLAQQYQIEGFPTVVVLDGDGRKVWEWGGYFQRGPTAFVAELEKARKG